MPNLHIYHNGQLVQATADEVAGARQALGAAAEEHTHTGLMTQAQADKLAGLPDAAALAGSLAGKASLVGGKLDPAQVPDIAPVSSVNGKSGSVVLTPADIGSVRQEDLGPLALMTLPEAQAAVSGYTVADFAALQGIASPRAGMIANVASPVVAGGTPYTGWIYDGLVWRLQSKQSLYDSLASVVGIASTTEQALFSAQIPAALLLSLRRLYVSWTMTRSGATNGLTTRLRFGLTGISGSTVISQDTGLTANLTRGYEHIGGALNSTTWRQVHTGLAGFGPLFNTGVAAPIDTTVPSMSGDLFIVIGAQMAGTTDIPTLSALSIQGV